MGERESGGEREEGWESVALATFARFVHIN